ncbi:MAG TPA: Gfo/Idh/MocA family oxidoreductase, partial [Nitrospiraceae bacterium]|nr:Gfo/Idh/MocA family oxidoreductase [Nitrospiraceae bacterium]
MIRFAVIGYGYWGPNIVRNLQNVKGAQVVAVGDKSEVNLERARRAFPGVQVSTDCDEILKSPDIDAVAVITPVWTHYELARQALLNGKHVFVEKPFTSNSKQAEELIELAEKKGLTIMVDHTFLFTGS